MMPDAAMYFAAGLGTRMRPLTATRPKPLVVVGRTTLLDHALELGKAAGVRRHVVNIHYLGEMIARHVAGKDVTISDESEILLDTGGGLKKALPLLDGDPVYTMNTDAVWHGPNPFDVLRASWDADRMGALLLLIPQGRVLGHKGTGDFLQDTEGRLSRGAGAVYSGAQILRTGPVADCPEDVFSLNRIWAELEAEGRLFGVLYSGTWCDVGRPESIPLAENLMRRSADV